MFTKEQPYQSANPKRKKNRIHDHGLIGDECHRPAHHVTVAHANVVHQFQERKVVMHLPKQIRQ